MAASPSSVDEKVAEVERARKTSLLAMRLISLVASILVFSASTVQVTNDLFNYVPVAWWLSVPCFILSFLDIIVEYRVRQRVPLVEGKSEHLYWVQLKIKELNVVLEIYETLRRDPDFSPEISTEMEVTAILAALREHTARLTYEESTLVVTVPARRVNGDSDGGRDRLSH
jgi:hypothetical protein